MRSAVLLGTWLSLVVASPGTGALAQAGPTKSAPGAAVYFIDLKTGATIPPSTTIHFGLRGMGVTAAGHQKDNSGHHHLLIDTELPPLDKEIPNDANHLHFGAGQTETLLELPPGEHTLQLLLADHKHVPHNPPVMSERIRVTVKDPSGAGGRKSARARRPSPAGARVYIADPKEGAYVSRTPLIRFGLVNMGVAPAGFAKANTGHHHLLIDTEMPPFDKEIPNDFNHLHFGAGQTEAKVTLPLGRHKLQLLLADEDHVPHDPPIYSKPITVIVTANGKPPRAKRRRPQPRA